MGSRRFWVEEEAHLLREAALPLLLAQPPLPNSVLLLFATFYFFKQRPSITSSVLLLFAKQRPSIIQNRKSPPLPGAAPSAPGAAPATAGERQQVTSPPTATRQRERDNRL